MRWRLFFRPVLVLRPSLRWFDLAGFWLPYCRLLRWWMGGGWRGFK